MRNPLRFHSSRVSDALELRNNVVMSSFLNLKQTVMRDDVTRRVLDNFNGAGRDIVFSQSFAYTAVQLPRYVIECAFLTGVAVLYYFSSLDSTFIAFAFGGLRLLPHTQALYNAIASIQAGRSSFGNVTNYFEKNEIQLFQNLKSDNPVDTLNEIDSVDIFEIEDLNVTIENKKIISDFSYTFSLSQKPLMVVGPTGSGKSTLVDIICGLYPSYYNHIKLNSLIYHDINIKKFQSTISYVPQFFFCRKGMLGEFLLEANAQFSNRYAAKLLKTLNLNF